MVSRQKLKEGIPISTSLQSTLEKEQIGNGNTEGKKRILYISLLAVGIAAAISFIASFLVHLISLVTNISFYGRFSFAATSPQFNHMGPWVIIIPAIGGIIIGFMALYGSKAIRGHGIPEAMEQILTNDSKIKPTITYLKPLSSAIAIGTGGPFGAEGPIIATGGALGSTIGQLLKISHYERKILLAAGATAGMSAIFGSPVAGIFLAIELLLFEFSAGSIIPVALACITGAAGHHMLFEAGPVFPIANTIAAPSNSALFIYSALGIVIGVLSVAITKIVYYLEDLFEKLPIHWMWWPAIGGIIVGIVGYFNPRTLGVGYNSITDVLSGSLTVSVVLSLCVLKLTSWAIALASGTSGGTLAPLLTIGGATGALMGMALQHFFPAYGISVPLAALVGMSAMFAGASRALLTSIVFALETTGQVNALLPLLAACTIAYFISLYLMENTIMTEKIARRGVKTPTSYQPDVLEQFVVKQVMNEEGFIISADNKIGALRDWLLQRPDLHSNYFVIVNEEGVFNGIVSSSNLFSEQHNIENTIGLLIKRRTIWLSPNDSLKHAVELMVTENTDLLPVVNEDQVVIGTVGYKDVLAAYRIAQEKHQKSAPHISLKRQTMKLLLRGQHLINLSRK
jgi:H+/Cl- antiporter ClcA